MFHYFGFIKSVLRKLCTTDYSCSPLWKSYKKLHELEAKFLNEKRCFNVLAAMLSCRYTVDATSGSS